MPWYRLEWRDPEELFKKAVGLSLFLHLLLWAGFSVRGWLGITFERKTIEIDLTKPFRVGGNPLLRPGGGTTTKPVAKEGPPAKPEEKPPETKTQPPKDWVLPGPETKEIEKPLPEAPPKTDFNVPGGTPEGTGEGWEGTGKGWGGGEGEGGGLPLTAFPKLLNRPEVLRLLRNNYPPDERAMGRQGVVVVDLHIADDGRVTGVDVVDSGGASFDRVADMVARRMRFSPAKMNARAVAVKIRQSITFQLENE